MGSDDHSNVFENSELAKKLGVNGMAICDLGHPAFFIGVEADEHGNHFIRLLKCIGCGQKMPVPFQSFTVPPPGPTVARKNVTLIGGLVVR